VLQSARLNVRSLRFFQASPIYAVVVSLIGLITTYPKRTMPAMLTSVKLPKNSLCVMNTRAYLAAASDDAQNLYNSKTTVEWFVY